MRIIQREEFCGSKLDFAHYELYDLGKLINFLVPLLPHLCVIVRIRTPENPV